MKQNHSIESYASTSVPMSSSLVQERLLLLRKTYGDIKRKEKEAQSKRYHRALHGSASEVHLRLHRKGLESMEAIKKMQKKYSSCDSSSCCTFSTDDSRSVGSGTSSGLYKEEGQKEMKVRMNIIKK